MSDSRSLKQVKVKLTLEWNGKSVEAKLAPDVFIVGGPKAVGDYVFEMLRRIESPVDKRLPFE